MPLKECRVVNLLCPWAVQHSIQYTFLPKYQ